MGKMSDIHADLKAAGGLSDVSAPDRSLAMRQIAKALAKEMGGAYVWTAYQNEAWASIGAIESLGFKIAQPIT